MKKLEKYFDHTILKPQATLNDIKKVCDEAKLYQFHSVCVNGCHVKSAYEELKETDILVSCVIGFPLGANETEIKAAEAQLAIKKGAKELDMVMNIGALKEKRYSYVEEDIKAVVAASKGKSIVKVIIEACFLTPEEIVQACKLAQKAGADFVKTSTGFLGEGAKTEHVKLMKDSVGDSLEVKASGGIRDLKTVQEMIAAGADRIGASASVAIMNEFEELLKG